MSDSGFASDEDRSAPAAPRHLPASESDARAALHRRIDNDFVYHTPTRELLETYATLREKHRALAHFMAGVCPIGRELSSALTKLEEAVMHANAGIARKGR